MDMESVISGAIEGIEGSEAGAAADAATDAALESAQSGVDATVTGSEITGQTTGHEQVGTDPLADDPLAKELGLKSRMDGKENRIPYSRVKMITANAEKKAKAELLQQVADAHGVDVKTLDPGKLKDYLGGRETSFASERAEVTQMREVEKIMQADEDRFMEMLAGVNPKYRKFVEAVKGAAGQQTGLPEAVKALNLPEPDFDLGNGQKTYSLEGIQSALRWAIEEGKRQATDAATTVVNQKFKPLEESAASRERIATQTARMQSQWNDARQKLNGFTDHEQEILALIRADTKAAQTEKRRPMTVKEAWADVMFPKREADRAKIRAELIAEGKKTVTGTSTATQTQAAAAQTGPVSMEDIIKQSIAKLPR